VSPGVIVSGGEIVRSIVSPHTYVHSWAQVEDSVVMHGTRIGRHSKVVKTILDKNVVVEEGAEVGVDLARDIERGYTVTESGITVVPKGTVVTK
jgi:glucose-1-phosphate adenylyltransferase